MSTEWDDFVLKLNRYGISLKNTEDKLIWNQNVGEGSVTARLAYNCIMELDQYLEHIWWANLIWGSHFALKISCFMWLYIKKNIHTWKNLQKKGFIGPGICYLCHEVEETLNHLFGS